MLAFRAVTLPFKRLTLAFLLPLEIAIFSLLTATLLDTFVIRPIEGGGSITTLLPGFVYACATIMKLCLLATPLTLWAALRSTTSAWPAFAITSLSLPPASLLLATLLVILTQQLSSSPAALVSDFPALARNAVRTLLFCLAIGATTAVISIYRRERPRSLAYLSLFVALCLIGLICYFRFFHLQFDQDNWAPH